MIPIELTFLAFLALAIITSSRTYFILALFSLLNVYIYPYTSENDLALLDNYASLDLAVGIAILQFGDIHKVYQSIILVAMIACHELMEQALNFDFYYDITSIIYESMIAALLIAQMMGVFRGTDSLSYPCFNLWKVHRINRFNHNQSLQI